MVRSALILMGLLCTVAAKADFVPLTVFSTAYGSGFNGFAYDPVTQSFYSHHGYGYPSSQPVLEYNNVANFATGISSGSITLPDSPYSSPAGTYFVVNNGVLYGRPDYNSNMIAMWNASTGTLVGSTTIAGIGGANGTDTFNWAGFSGLNLYNDDGSLYMLGKSGTHWEILSIASDLSVTRTLVTSFSSLGYAFVINGELFAGDSYNSNPSPIRSTSRLERKAP